METLRADADQAQINGDAVAGPQFSNEVDVMLQIHGSRLPTAMIGIGQPYCRIKGVTRIVKYGDEMSDVHMQIAVGPFGTRDRLIAGQAKLANLFWNKLGRLHPFIYPSSFYRSSCGAVRILDSDRLLAARPC